MLTFDPECHAFKRGHNQIPSVTQVLRNCGLTSRWGSAEALQRGTRVHRALEAVQSMDDKDVRETLLDNDVPFYEAGLRAMSTFGIEVLASEELVDGGTYAGWLDLRCHIRGEDEPFVLDFKTGSLAPSTRLQLMAYAVPQPIKHRRAALVLRPTGTPKLVVFKYDMQDLYDWRACLTVSLLQRDTGGPDD